MKTKQVLFGLSLLACFVVLYGDATSWQFAPFAIFSGLMALDLFGHKDMTVPAIVTSIFMIVINLYTDISEISLIDLFYWVICAVVYFVYRNQYSEIGETNVKTK